MKTTFRALALMTIVLATFSSCKKDSKSSNDSSFTYDAKTYNTTSGQYFTTGGSSGMLILSSGAISLVGYTGTVSYVQFMFDQGAIPEGTFTFKDGGDNTFDAAKNFSDASAGIDFAVSNGTPTGGTQLNGALEGTVTITKSGSNYSITYTLTFDGGKTAVTGKFNGAIQTAQAPV